MKKYTIWRLSDAHDTFEVEGKNLLDACLKVLEKLDWAVEPEKIVMNPPLRFIPMLLKKNPKRWAIWDRKKNSWAESQTGHLFIYAKEEAATRKAEKLEEADK